MKMIYGEGTTIIMSEIVNRRMTFVYFIHRIKIRDDIKENFQKFLK